MKDAIVCPDCCEQEVDMTEADKTLKDICEGLVLRAYTGNEQNLAMKRLMQELSIVRKLNAAQIFLNLRNLMNHLRLENNGIIARGIGGSSIIAYLLGISSACPIRYELPIEFVFGIPPYKHMQLDISVPMSAFCELAYIDDDAHLSIVRATDIKHVDYYKAFHYDDKGNLINQTRILGDDTLDEICESDIKSSDTRLEEIFDRLVNDDQDVLSQIPYFDLDLSRELLHVIKPKSLSDFARVFGYVHSSYSAPISVLIKEAEGYVLPASRDELFRMICDFGLDRAVAYQIADACAKGKVSHARESKWSEWEQMLRDHGATEKFIHMCRVQIRYLFPECHNLNFAIKALTHYRIEREQDLLKHSEFDLVFTSWDKVIQKMRASYKSDEFESRIKPMWVQTVGGDPIVVTIIIPSGMDSDDYDRCYKSLIIATVFEITRVEIADIYFITESDMEKIYEMYEEEERLEAEKK